MQHPDLFAVQRQLGWTLPGLRLGQSVHSLLDLLQDVPPICFSDSQYIHCCQAERSQCHRTVSVQCNCFRLRTFTVCFESPVALNAAETTVLDIPHICSRQSDAPSGSSARHHTKWVCLSCSTHACTVYTRTTVFNRMQGLLVSRERLALNQQTGPDHQHAG